MIRYEDFTLSLSPDGSHVEVFSSPFGLGLSAPFIAPMDPSELPSVLYMTASGDLEKLGQRLFQSLFPPPIAQQLVRCLARAEASEGQLGIRIRLVLRWPHELRYLQALPWELLLPPENVRFLSRRQLTAVVRTPMATGHPTSRALIEPPLRVLLLLSQPLDSSRLSLADERKRIEGAFAQAAGHFRMAPPVLEVLEAPLTVDAFRAKLCEGFHVVHFAGHGDFNSSGAGTLLFENADRSNHPFDGRTLAEYLQVSPELRLAVLNACWSALPGVYGEAEADLGVGTALAENGVPAVVAMQQPIADAAATEFSGTLYAQLALGDPLELAMFHARIQLAEKYPETPSWAIPVLLLGAESGEIVRPAGLPAQQPTSIAHHIRNVSWLVHDKTRDFVGRRFLFDLVDQKLANEEGCILLEAEPGFGKTSFLAELVRRHRHVHHFNRLASADSNQTEHFLANMTAQLIQRYQLPYPALPVEAQRNSDFLVRLCEEASHKLEVGQRLVLVIDALDEVDRQGESTARNPLDLPFVLPPNCAMIVTTRPNSNTKLQFENAKFEPMELDPRTAENYADVEERIRLSLDRGEIPNFCRRHGITQEDLVARLSERSAGNFMYLRYVLADLERGSYQNITLDELPRGLVNYYEHQWLRLEQSAERRKEDSFLNLAVPTLAALTAIRRPVSIDLIAALIERPGERAEIAATLRSLRQFLRIEEHPQDQRQKVFQLYHGSFHDFIGKQPEVFSQQIEEQMVRFFDRPSKA